jgi:hypothetical protein
MWGGGGGLQEAQILNIQIINFNKSIKHVASKNGLPLSRHYAA